MDRGRPSRSCTRSRSTFEYVHLAQRSYKYGPHAAVWRQAGPDAAGAFETYQVEADISEDMSFLEMLDVLNERLIQQGEEPVAFEHDCREGICGSCGVMINGQAARPPAGHGHLPAAHAQVQATATPSWSSRGAPRPSRCVKDLVVDRSAFDRIIEAGGFISVPTGSAPDANLTLVPKDDADLAMDAAACIGCGACVAACPNGAGQLFTAAKLAHLNLLPQGQPERYERAPRHGRHHGGVLRLLHQPRRVRGGLPQGDQHRLHRLMNRDYLKAKFKNRKLLGQRN